MKDKVTSKDVYESIQELRLELKKDILDVKTEIKSDIAEIKRSFVLKAEFLPVKTIVYGLVAIILVAVVGAVVTLVVTNA